ncbi:MAG TPA: glycosyltransferase [Pyrinomonadaceae bacterium]|nr:glycosyltransferase [Pyrinomonadaceae bacterium]
MDHAQDIPGNGVAEKALPMSGTGAPIFFDPSGRRWRHVRRLRLMLAAIATVLIAILIVSILVNPLLPHLDLRPKTPALALTRRDQNAQHAQAELKKALHETKKAAAEQRPQVNITHPISLPPGATPVTRPLTIGFYVNWDDASYSSLNQNLGQLDWIVPEWVRLQDGTNPLAQDVDPRVLDLLQHKRPDLRIVPLVQNYKDEHWNPEILTRAIADENARTHLVNSLLDFVTTNKFAGVCIDFEEVPPEAQHALLQFMKKLHTAFAARGLLVAEAVPFENADWNYHALAQVTDYLMLMAYDQHWSEGEPGPIAAQDWFERGLRYRLKELDPARTIVCLGAYGYDWSDQSDEATELTFQEAMLSARDSEASIDFDTASRNPTFSYDEDDGSHHDVWFLDAVTTRNEIRLASAYGPAGFALWRLGSEDPSVWTALRTQPQFQTTDGLEQIRYGYDIDFEGTGEVLQVAAEPHDGSRDVTVEPYTGLISSEKYTEIPSSYVIKRAGDRPGLVALTFDDGPDPTWTPRILDILKQENVPATFFIIGQNGQANPELVRRIVNEGHDVGNHTFTHPNLGEMPGRVTDLELNATQRLIEAITGRSTVLFRPPYFGDAEPTTPDEVDPVVRAERLGYLTVGLQVDPNDWALPGTDQIVKQTIAGVTNPEPDQRGEVVLLHDGGGVRSETVAALPQIIHELRARGFRFVTVSELMGLTRDQTMPLLPAQSRIARIDGITFFGFAVAGWALQWLFIAGIVLGVGRLLFVGSLALVQRLAQQRFAPLRLCEKPRPFVSVIVPAYNEERVIAQTVRSLLASDYPEFEIIVVDDGSSDATCEVVQDNFDGDPRVILFTKENDGKAEALNYGLRRARGEIIVALDGDTIFEPNTIGALASRFDDPRVGAVAGNAKVGNRINTITRWQALEYITSQNLDRRAFAELNCITVVPGAVGAWRRGLIEQAGGFTSDTLAEDQDLTLRIRRLGSNIAYEENAIAWTEAPDTIRGLAKQRFRWSFGTLQCMWKHRDALLRPRYGTLGLIAMPNVWLFQILFPLVSPVMDLMVVWAIVSAALERYQHPHEFSALNLRQIVFYYALFLTVDWLAAAYAFMLERRERWSLLWWLFLQRFGYRQVMYYVMVKSVFTAARGALVGWGKLERKATVEV